ncbi:MAG: carbohydrate binding family 9 domain-containing protein [Gemmatimonadetes bacterium]|nr:carbohydrate binding family 9 domain-containing protein [Gemmatimonadota bacterium]
MTRWLGVAVATALCCASDASAQAQEGVTPPIDTAHAGQSVYHGREGQLDVALPRIDADIRVDGILDEDAWSRAALLTGFSQFSPVDRLPAEDSTEVLVFYSEDAIHFGIRAFEPHGTVNATLADRDRIGGDDNIQIILDTFNDRRRALVFMVNPHGVQGDGTFADGSNVDMNPDFIFESKGRITPYGYEIEVKIPFKSIRYQPADVQDWGINILRRVQHSGHEQTWTPVERSLPSFLAQSGTFTGMAGLRRGLVLDINPVMTARALGAATSPTDPAWRYQREDPEFGGNVRWGVTANLTMNGTINPDFSQVEADVGQVSYDPRAALFFPEKRPFFLDGSENFATPNQLIYTRAISSPEAAVKFNGKVGGLNLGVLSAVDDRSLSASGDDHPVFNIVRMRRDLGSQSNAGIVYTDRIDGDDYNRVAGVDTRMMLGRYVLNGQIASSFTSSAGETSHWRPLFDVSLNRPGRDWGFNTFIRGFHPEFVAGSGFLSRTGIARAYFSPRRSFFPQNSIIETFSTSLILDGTWDWQRFRRGTEPNDIKVNTSTNFSLRGGWHTTVYTWLESFMYPANLYTNYYIERRTDAGAVLDTVAYTGTHRLPNYGLMLSLRTPQFQTFSGSAEILAGHDDNFDEWSSAWVYFATLNGDWRPTDKVRVNARYLEQRFHRVTDGSLVRLRMIPRLKVEYQIARPVFLRFVGQYDATRIAELRDDSRTNDPILIRRPDGTFRRADAVQRSGFRADWLFSYQPNPGTVLFAGYGTSLNGAAFFEPRDMERTSDGFFVKVSYLFRM